MPELDVRLSTRAWVAAAVAVLAPTLAFIGIALPFRPLLALAFFLLVPGVALVELLRMPSALVSWSLAIGLSLAVNILVAQVALVLGFWDPLAGSLVIAVTSLTILLVAQRRDRRGRPVR